MVPMWRSAGIQFAEDDGYDNGDDDGRDGDETWTTTTKHWWRPSDSDVLSHARAGRQRPTAARSRAPAEFCLGLGRLETVLTARRPFFEGDQPCTRARSVRAFVCSFV